MVGKLDTLQNNFYQLNTQPDILALTETWLHKDITSNSLGLFNFNIYRCDRVLSEGKSKSGGALIAVHKRFKSKFLLRDSTLSEQVFIELILNKTKYIFGCIYIPPAAHNDIFTNHQENIEHLCQKYPVHKWLVVGDFNLPNVKLLNSPLDYNLISNLDANRQLNVATIHSTYSQLSCKQYYSNHFNKSYSLDLFFGPENYNITSVELDDFFLNTDKHHTALLFTIKQPSTDYLDENFNERPPHRNFYKANYTDINTSFQNSD